MSAPEELPASLVLAARRLVRYELETGLRYALVCFDLRSPRALLMAASIPGNSNLEPGGSSFLVDVESWVRGYFGLREASPPLPTGERLAVVVDEGGHFAGRVRLALLLGEEDAP